MDMQTHILNVQVWGTMTNDPRFLVSQKTASKQGAKITTYAVLRTDLWIENMTFFKGLMRFILFFYFVCDVFCTVSMLKNLYYQSLLKFLIVYFTLKCRLFVFLLFVFSSIKTAKPNIYL